MGKASVAFMVAAGLALAGCGTTVGDRGLSGAAIGAGTGAVAAAILGGPVGAAALVGGAVGAVAGAATSPAAVDLGKPVWRQ